MKRATLLCPLFILFIFILAPAVLAQSPTDLTTLAVANQLYENGRFAEAAQTYEQLVAGGFHDPTIYYNLGNAYYRQADIGRAILNYERAARIAPRDAGIRANLQLAREQLVDQMAPDDSALSQITLFARSWLTLNEMAVATLTLWFLLAACWLFYRRRSTTLLRVLLALTAVLLLSGIFSLGTRLYSETSRPVGIIVAPETAVTSIPGSQNPGQFTLHSGTAVTILDQHPQWTRISLSGDQLQGWVPASAVTAVAP